jgi:choline-sulfatase
MVRWKDGKLEDEIAEGYLTDVITQDAIDFIENNGHADAPFCLQVHYNAPHRPWKDNHPVELADLYRECQFETCPQEPEHPWYIYPDTDIQDATENLIGYYAAITGVDRGVGRIVEKLEQLGIRENTLIVFTSDNGYNCGQHGIWGKGNATFPQNMFDTSVKIPGIFNHPGRIPGGIIDSKLASHYDLFPTLLDYAGIANPYKEKLPGTSLVSRLFGKPREGDEKIVVFDEYGPVRMIRTLEWKYIHRYPYGPHELYHLRNDPEERVNLFESPEYVEVVQSLKGDLDAWFAQYVNPQYDGIKESVFGYGQIGLVGEQGKGRKSFTSYLLAKHKVKIVPAKAEKTK